MHKKHKEITFLQTNCCSIYRNTIIHKLLLLQFTWLSNIFIDAFSVHILYRLYINIISINTYDDTIYGHSVLPNKTTYGVTSSKHKRNIRLYLAHKRTATISIYTYYVLYNYQYNFPRFFFLIFFCTVHALSSIPAQKNSLRKNYKKRHTPQS